jgi:hypothetical protein
MNLIVIMDVSKQPYFSIARHYGGAKVNGHEYVYHPAKDALIRKDWVKKMKFKSWEQFLELVKASEE